MQPSRRQVIKAAGSALAAAGALKAITLSASENLPSTNPNASFPVRELYCPVHFGNAYEAMWPLEMQAYLAEMKWWGFNRYSDWFTATDARNPYRSDAYWDLATEQLARKKRAFLAAEKLGMAVNLIVTPNHVYLDQMSPELDATKGPRIAGQLLCPSKAPARKIILENAKNAFTDLAHSGISLGAITAFAYDYGGCACSQCKPWILTWAKLMREVHAIALQSHPKVEMWMCSWWWTAEEHALLNEWAAKEAPGWIKAITLHIEYDQTRFKDVPVPAGCQKLAFIHNCYSDSRATNDIYGKCGPMIAPRRLPQTLRDIAQQGASGFQAYSEGLFDDCNKAILAGIASGRFRDPADALKAYADRYFAAADAGNSDQWARWLAAWGNRRDPKLPQALEEFEDLARRAPPTWRLEHWRSKLKLESLDRAIGTPTQWSPAELRLVDEFWAEQEHLNRDVYRLGPQRHVFARKFSPPAWYDSWIKATRSNRTSSTLPAQT